MVSFSKFFTRFSVALGGFLIFVGIIVTCVFIVGYLGVVDFSILESDSFESLSLVLSMTIGFIDLIAGIILWRR